MTLAEWTWYDLTVGNTAQVPEVGGVYMLADPPRSGPTTFYVGESETLRTRVSQHLYDDQNLCIRRHLSLGPRLFCYKVVPGGAAARRVEEDAVIGRYRPECNVRSRIV